MATPAQRLDSAEEKSPNLKKKKLIEGLLGGAIGTAAELVAGQVIHAFTRLSLAMALLWALPVAGAIAAGYFLYRIRRLLKPGGPTARALPVRLTWAQLDFEKLVQFANEFQPDAIVGINRGGAIAGGIVAKRLHKPVYLLAVEKSGGGITVTEQWRAKIALQSARVLLVDDACRTGGHLQAAIDHLKCAYPQAHVRTAVLLQLKVFSPGGPAPSHSPADFALFPTELSNLRLPWDPE
jgi:hypothetical protein